MMVKAKIRQLQERKNREKRLNQPPVGNANVTTSSGLTPSSPGGMVAGSSLTLQSPQSNANVTTSSVLTTPPRSPLGEIGVGLSPIANVGVSIQQQQQQRIAELQAQLAQAQARLAQAQSSAGGGGSRQLVDISVDKLFTEDLKTRYLTYMELGDTLSAKKLLINLLDQILHPEQTDSKCPAIRDSAQALEWIINKVKDIDIDVATLEGKLANDFDNYNNFRSSIVADEGGYYEITEEEVNDLKEFFILKYKAKKKVTLLLTERETKINALRDEINSSSISSSSSDSDLYSNARKEYIKYAKAIASFNKSITSLEGKIDSRTQKGIDVTALAVTLDQERSKKAALAEPRYFANFVALDRSISSITPVINELLHFANSPMYYIRYNKVMESLKGRTLEDQILFANIIHDIAYAYSFEKKEEMALDYTPKNVFAKALSIWWLNKDAEVTSLQPNGNGAVKEGVREYNKARLEQCTDQFKDSNYIMGIRYLSSMLKKNIRKQYEAEVDQFKQNSRSMTPEVKQAELIRFDK
ncbi:MAG: hypothetical protein HOM96_02675, partial [Rickettsiales bacterium]|nr:hypothetical protein [Rickettsiales bacterium]